MRIMQFGGLYFLITVTLHFLVQQIRQLPILPQVGRRAAGLVEAPIMLVLIFITAAVLVRLIGSQLTSRSLLIAGAFATGLLIVSGLLLDIGVSGYRPSEYFLNADRTTRAVYLGGLFVFALSPALVQQIRTKQV
ncbi:hypothetical protein KOR42_33520 [Thalassoglobus neptunius]|uniref:Uncharacterized protein n=1 Tax=Thalassoglobus neptunius TaxID=1938619 RepID=A0A5C5WMM9_9PLAN|nr:hypothetical protein [Thalassoglobus neptunius]TWT51878.1 hypothetical protein KOR42_33520 [Thalassoglobus neptunius]